VLFFRMWSFCVLRPIRWVFECDLRTRLQNKSIFFSISGGFFNTHLPVWMQWAKYLSIFHYPYACLNILSTRDLPVLWYVYTPLFLLEFIGFCVVLFFRMWSFCVLRPMFSVYMDCTSFIAPSGLKQKKLSVLDTNGFRLFK
jgi:hypothetical protein